MALSVIQTSTTVSATARAVAEIYSTFANQILLVAGADTSGDSLSSFSDFWIGATEIVAPAEGILTLDYPTGVISRSGVSFAASFVAGVAAQLRAMDSTLTAAQVKDYILRGAREPRLNPATAQYDPPSPVGDAPEPVYHLDAYGALTLLSRERPGTPLCGYQVSTDEINVILEPRNAPARQFPVPGLLHWVSEVSVAQGGRLISAVDGPPSGSDTRSVIFDQNGQVIREVSGVRRTFLERDTVDALPTDANRSYPLYVFRRHDGTVETLDPFRMAVPTSRDIGEGVGEISPLGEHAAIRTVEDFGEEFRRIRWYLVPLNGDPPTLLGERPWCTSTDPPWICEDQGSTAWSHDSRRAVFLNAGYNFDGVTLTPRTTVTNAPLGSSATTVTLTDRWLLGPRLTADDSFLLVGEDDWLSPDCVVARRPVSDLTVVLATQPGRWESDCSSSRSVVIPNAPIAR